MPSFADLLLRTVDGVFVVDARQRIVHWNPGCEQLFGLPIERTLGRRCSEIVRGKDPVQQPVCGGCCCLASFADDPNIPSMFPLRAVDAAGGELRLTVSVLLMPSIRKEQRLCVHLLRRDSMTDPLLALQKDERLTRQQLSSEGANGSAPADPCGLTTREREILRLLSEGMAVSAIAQLMRISVVTVRNHVHHIETKLAVHSQAEAVAYAYRHNLA